jgi:hypothetical protein
MRVCECPPYLSPASCCLHLLQWLASVKTAAHLLECVLQWDLSARGSLPFGHLPGVSATPASILCYGIVVVVVVVVAVVEVEEEE